MVLGFNPRFVDKILNGTKVHTIRADIHDRWKAGRSIQFATGVRTKYYKQFKEGVCVSTQKIEIKYYGETPVIKVDNQKIGFAVPYLSLNDGFETLGDFFEWFDKDFTGKIIHFTYKRY